MRTDLFPTTTNSSAPPSAASSANTSSPTCNAGTPTVSSTATPGGPRARRDCWACLCPRSNGGPGETDYRFRVVIQEEIARVGRRPCNRVLHQRRHRAQLPAAPRHRRAARALAAGFVTGETIGAIAMGRPGQAATCAASAPPPSRRRRWVINNSKTFITSGNLAGLVIVFAKTAAENTTGSSSNDFSLFVVEDGAPGFARGLKLDKVGLRAGHRRTVLRQRPGRRETNSSARWAADCAT